MIPPLLLLPLFLLLQPTHATNITSTPTPAATPTRTLLFVAELCRHGDRSPLESFPSDTLPLSSWPQGKGQLTPLGIRAHYDLGARLRSRYVSTNFLSGTYNRSEVQVRSTAIDRALMSATSQLAGLFPPGTAATDDVRTHFGAAPLEDSEAGLPSRFQPVPVHSEAKDTDPLLLPGNYCPRHQFLLDQKKQSAEYRDAERREETFLKQAAHIAAWNKSDPFTLIELEKLHDTWRCFAAHQVPLPKGATEEFVARARNLSNWLGVLYNSGKEAQRLRAGLLLHHIKTHMAAAYLSHTNSLPDDFDPPAKKFLLLSAHDTTVAAALSAMQVYDGKNPPYNSTVIWELFQEPDESLTVRVEYNGKALLLPHCSREYCPLQEYIYSTHERTVYGRTAREFECLVGWRRYLAMLYYPFTRERLHPLLASFGSPDDSADGSGASLGLVLSSVIAFAVALFGIFGLIRLRSRYNGYAPADLGPKVEDYDLNHAMSERRILM